MNNSIKFSIGVAALALAGTASASTTWSVPTGSVTQDGITMTATGWSNTGSGGSIDTQALQAQTLSLYGGGVGITNLDSGSDAGEGASPEHAVDNNGRYEMVLLSFSQAVKLTAVKAGWASGTDSDITVMAYNGPGTGSGSLNGNTWAGIAGAWTSIGNYANVGTNTTAVNAGNTSSSYWLIGAYNNLLINSGWSTGNDYVKLASVTTTSGGQVPLPGTLALLGLGLLGMVSMRQRPAA